MSTPPQLNLLTRLDIWLRKVGKVRDGILVVGGAAYILGYVVWSVNAYIKGVGLLPAFESQYFIAGTVPLLIFFLAYRLINFSWARNLNIPWWLNIWETRKAWATMLNLLPGLFVIGSVILSKTGATKYFVGRSTLIGGIVVSIAGLLFVLAIFSIDPNSPDPLSLRRGAAKAKWKERILIGIRLVIIAAAGIVVLYFYVGLLYSKLPQSLGGVRPRCAYLDFEKKGVSQNTLRAVSPLNAVTPSPVVGSVNPAASEPEIVKSDRVEVLFSGSDYILIRIRGEVYEIKKDVVHAVQACE